MRQLACVAVHRLHLCDQCHIRRVNVHAVSDIFSFHAGFDFLTHRDFIGVYFPPPLTARDVDNERSTTGRNMEVFSQFCDRYEDAKCNHSPTPGLYGLYLHRGLLAALRLQRRRARMAHRLLPSAQG